MRPTRVGVTGHRRLPHPEQLASAVDRLLDEWPGGVVVSPLAEGADRLVAERALARPGWELDVLLPLPATDFADDFADDESRAAFADLVERATTVSVIPGQVSREEAYYEGGRRMVDDVDVLVALWDGKPSRGRGGTAEVIEYARSIGRRVEVIPVTPC